MAARRAVEPGASRGISATDVDAGAGGVAGVDDNMSTVVDSCKS